MSILNLFNQAEQKVEQEVKAVEGFFKKEETVVVQDLQSSFAKAKELAAAANSDVDKLKSQLAL